MNYANDNTSRLANAIVENGFGTPEMVEKTLANGKRLPFMTFKAWKELGYQVQKGEKHAFKVNLWIMTGKKDADGNLVNNGYTLKTCYIFTGKQVKPIEDSQTVKAEEPKAEPKTEEKPKKERKVKAKKTEPKKTESKKKTRKAKTEKVAKATSQSEKTEKKSTFETWTDPANPNVHYVKYEKKSKAKTRKAEPKKTEKAEPKKAEPKLVKEIKKSEPKKVTKKAEKKLAKAPTMVRKDFVKDGIKMVNFECSDGTRGFTMPLKKYEETTKTFRKLWGII